jgi:hypothetical protein
LRAGWPDHAIDHVAGRENWLYVIARTSIAIEPD